MQMVVHPYLYLYSKLMENKLKTLHVPHPHVGLACNLKSCFPALASFPLVNLVLLTSTQLARS